MLERKPSFISRDTPETHDSPEESEEKFEYKIIKDRELREDLYIRTKELVAKVVDDNIDTLVFLDKSARPISWLFRELWKYEQPGVKTPNIKFVNIGHGHGLHHDVKTQHIQSIYEEEKRRIQQIFRHISDDKQILIVDEIVANGTSLAATKQLFEQAFPEADIETKGIFSIMEITQMPWMLMPGATDVIALDDELFARAMHEKQIDQYLEKSLEDISAAIYTDNFTPSFGYSVKSAVDHFERGFKELKKGKLNKTIKKYTKSPFLFKERSEIHTFLQSYEELLEEHPPDGSETKKFLLYLGKVIHLMNEEDQLSETLKQHLQESIENKEEKEKSEKLEKIIESLSKMYNHLYSMTYRFTSPLTSQQYSTLSILPALIGPSKKADVLNLLKSRGKQLRAEMKEIAKMDLTKD